MFNKFKKIINYIENSKVPLFQFVITFLFIITLRGFLESFSSKNFSSLFRLNLIINYDSFYLSLALTLILFFKLITKEKIIKIIKIVLTGFTVVILPPIIDLIISKGNGYLPTFFLPNIHKNLIVRFFTFFGNMEFTSYSNKILSGVTPGIKTEIILILIATFIYLLVKKINLRKNLFYTFLTYSIIFFYFSTIIIVKKISEIFHLAYNQHSTTTITNFYFIEIFFMGIILFNILNKKYLKIIIKDIRIFRLLHYELMFIIGTISLLLIKNISILNTEIISNYIIVIISIIFAWIYSVMTNNIEDQEIDKISNTDRPLVRNKIPLNIYKKISWLILAFALSYASLVNFKIFFLILLFIGNYFIYSTPPLRLKRVLFLSKIFISLNSLILFMAGFLVMQNNIKNIPLIIYPIFLVGLTVSINFIDIKDYAGDKKENIKTLPTVLGLKKSKKLIGFFFFLSYIFLPIIINNIPSIFLFVPLGILQFYFINKKDYKEKYVFITYLISLILFIFFLI